MTANFPAKDRLKIRVYETGSKSHSDVTRASEHEFVFYSPGDADDREALEAFKSLLIMSLTVPQGQKWEEFAEEVRRRSKEEFDYDFAEDVRNCVAITGIPD